MSQSILRRHLEEAESRIQRVQGSVDHHREAVSTLERDGQDPTVAVALLRVFEKALAVHVADRDRLLKDLQELKPRRRT
jgi:chorismate synthase